MLHPGFDDVTDVNTDPKGRFVSFKVKLIHLMTDFYVSMLLGVGGGGRRGQGGGRSIATENNWLGNASLKVYSLYGKQNQGE